jgi:hypothetical protein
MAQQNINQYAYQKSRLNLEYDSMDMSLTSDERDYSEEVVFSPFLIAETYGKKLPINCPETKNIRETITTINDAIGKLLCLSSFCLVIDIEIL